MRYAVPKSDSNDLLFLRKLIKVFEDQERADTSSQILNSFLPAVKARVSKHQPFNQHDCGWVNTVLKQLRRGWKPISTLNAVPSRCDSDVYRFCRTCLVVGVC